MEDGREEGRKERTKERRAWQPSSTCGVLCLFETLTSTPAVVARAVISAFEDAFDSCESVPDCPDPCRSAGACWRASRATPK